MASARCSFVFRESGTSARHYVVKELLVGAADVAQTNRVIATKRRHIALIKCSGSNAGHAEDLLETMLDVRAHHQSIHNQHLHALLTATTRPAMAY